jgi:hypothetical protein
MPDTPRQIASRLLPGWKVVRTKKTPRGAAAADSQTPGLETLRAAYGLKAAKVTEGLASASSSDSDTEFVIMEPPAGQESVGRKVVVISNGKAVAVQG